MNGGISFAEALGFWWKLGWISFGGPAGQIAIMHRELVERRRWISDRRFLHALNYCMVLPGPEAQQLATYLGWLMHGTRGGLAAGMLFVLPSLLILIVLSALYMIYSSLPWMAAVLYGVKAAVAALVLAAAWRIGSRTLKTLFLWGVAAAAFIALFVFGVPFPLILLSAALLGAIAVRRAPLWLSGPPGHARESGGDEVAVINAHSPVPVHARFTRARLLRVLAVCLALGLGGAALLVAVFGVQSVPVQMAWFFTKAAFLTFGGAYAVLPYVFEGAVQHHQWLTTAQMMDGLALGESTPGPLIMVVTFIGFVGGWTEAVRPAAGALVSMPAVAGTALVCALVSTFFTFLPSFCFILAGGPLVEATHDEVRLTGPLTCVTAAVVGVILNLAVFFVWKVFWPEGTAEQLFRGGADGPAILLAAIAFVVLVRTALPVMAVIGLCALAGLVVRMVV